MNDDYIEVRALDQSRIEGLKAWGWVSYLLHLVVAVAAVVPGWIAWTVISIWFLYRIVRGMVAMNRNQAVDR